MKWPPIDCRFRTHIKPMCAVDLECTNMNCPNYKRHPWSDVVDAVVSTLPTASMDSTLSSPPIDILAEARYHNFPRSDGRFELPKGTIELPDLSDLEVRKRLHMKEIDTEELFKNLPKFQRYKK